MTVLLEDLQTLLQPLAVGGAWYGVNTTEPPVYPYVVWQRISSTPNVTLAGQSDLQNTRVQIDIYSRRISEASAIESALEGAMASSAIVNVPLSSQDLYDEMVKAFRVSKDYSVWARN